MNVFLILMEFWWGSTVMVRWDFRILIGYLINSLILMMLGTSENGIYHGFIMVNPRNGNLNEEHDDTPLVLRVPQMG